MPGSTLPSRGRTLPCGPRSSGPRGGDPRALPGGVPRRCSPHPPPPTTAPDHCRQQRAVWVGCALSPFLEGTGEPGGPATSLRGNTGPLVMCPKDTQDGAEGRPCRDSAWPVAPPTGRHAHAPPTSLWLRLHPWLRPPCCGSAHSHAPPTSLWLRLHSWLRPHPRPAHLAVAELENAAFDDAALLLRPGAAVQVHGARLRGGRHVRTGGGLLPAVPEVQLAVHHHAVPRGEVVVGPLVEVPTQATHRALQRQAGQGALPGGLAGGTGLARACLGGPGGLTGTGCPGRQGGCTPGRRGSA